jgi:hypothetical protein
LAVEKETPMKRLTPWDLAYAADIAIACGISYVIITQALVLFIDKPADLLGGMWAVIAYCIRLQ